MQFDPQKLSDRPGSATLNQAYEIKARLNRYGKNCPRGFWDLSKREAYYLIKKLREADSARRRGPLEIEHKLEIEYAAQPRNTHVLTS